MAWNAAKTDPSITINGLTLTKASGSTKAISLWDTAASGSLSYFQFVAGQTNDVGVGLATSARLIDSSDIGADQTNSAGVYNNGWYLATGGNWQSTSGFAQGAKVGILWNPTTKEAKWDVDGTVILTETLLFPTGAQVFPAVVLKQVGDAVTGQPTPATLPQGAVAWGTGAPPVEPPVGDPTIPQTFDAITGANIPSVADGGPFVLDLLGRAQKGDTIRFSAMRTTQSDTGYAGVFTKTDANGQKWVIVPNSTGIEFEWTGCPVDTNSSDPLNGPASSPYFKAYLAYADANAGKVPGDVQYLNIRKPYFADQPWVISDFAVTLDFHGNNKRLTVGMLRIKAGQHGIILDDFTTLNGIVCPFRGRSAQGSSIINYGLIWQSRNPLPDEFGIAIWVRCKAKVSNGLTSQTAIGVYVHGDIAGGNGANANGAEVSDYRGQYHLYWTLGTQGSDANACNFRNIEAYGCGQAAISARDFLGNNLLGLWDEGNNGYGDPGVVGAHPHVVWHAGYYYLAVLATVEQPPKPYGTTTPGTPGTDNIWERLFPSATNSYYGGRIPEYTPGGTYEPGGMILAYNGNASWQADGIYSEDGRLPMQGAMGRWKMGGGGRGGEFSRHCSRGMLERESTVFGGYTVQVPDQLEDDVTHPENRLFVAFGQGFGTFVGNIFAWWRGSPGSGNQGIWRFRSLAKWSKPNRYALTAHDNDSLPIGGSDTLLFNPEISDNAVAKGPTSTGDYIHAIKLFLGKPGRPREVTFYNNFNELNDSLDRHRVGDIAFREVRNSGDSPGWTIDQAPNGTKVINEMPAPTVPVFGPAAGISWATVQPGKRSPIVKLPFPGIQNGDVVTGIRTFAPLNGTTPFATPNQADQCVDLYVVNFGDVASAPGQHQWVVYLRRS